MVFYADFLLICVLAKYVLLFGVHVFPQNFYFSPFQNSEHLKNSTMKVHIPLIFFQTCSTSVYVYMYTFSFLMNYMKVAGNVT